MIVKCVIILWKTFMVSSHRKKIIHFCSWLFNTQVQIASNTEIRLYETVDLQVTGTVLNDIYLDVDQAEVYILTSREVSGLFPDHDIYSW